LPSEEHFCHPGGIISSGGCGYDDDDNDDDDYAEESVLYILKNELRYFGSS